jgi:HEAT repeat protein
MRSSRRRRLTVAILAVTAVVSLACQTHPATEREKRLATTVPASHADVIAPTTRAVRSFFRPPPPPSVMSTIREMFEMDPQYIEKLLSAIDDPERPPHERSRLIMALAYLGPDAEPALPRLIEIAYDIRPPPLSEKDAAEDQRAPEYMGPAYKPGNPMRDRARQAVAGIGAPAVPTLKRYLKEGTPEQAGSSAQALAGIGKADKEAVSLMVDRLVAQEDPAWALTWARIVEQANPKALRSKKAQAALPRIVAATKMRAGTAGEAVALLPSFGMPASEAVPLIVGVLARALETEGEDAGLGGLGLLQTIAKYGRYAEPHLIRLAGDADPHVRAAAVNLLAAKGVAGEGGIAALRRAQDDPTPRVRDAAARTVRLIQSR